MTSGQGHPYLFSNMLSLSLSSGHPVHTFILRHPVIMDLCWRALAFLALFALTGSAQDCSGFHDAMCPLEDENILGFDNNVFGIAACQQK
jgi:hypothetical protein